MNEKLDDVKVSMAIVSEVIKAAGDNPDVKAAGSELGRTALTLTKTINNALLPIAAVNFAFEKAHRYFTDRFQADFSEKATSVPPEQIVEPKASIAGPALQGLAFSHEEPNLKDMYLNLLVSSMDGRVANKTHPAFVEIIRQLSSEEAHIIKSIFGIGTGLSFSIVEIRLSAMPDQSWKLLLKHLMNYNNTVTGEPLENPNMSAIVNNFVRLGLVEVDYNTHLIGEENYSWVPARPEFIQLVKQHESATKKVTYQKGILSRTAFGLEFAKTVGITSR